MLGLLNRLADGFSKTFHGPILIHSTQGMISLGFLAFSIIDLVIKILKNFSFLMIHTFFSKETLYTPNFFVLMTFGVLMTMLNWIPCFIGDQIEFNAGLLAQELYRSNWIETDIRNKKNLVVLQTILRMKEVQIRIGGFSALNVTAFLKLVNFAFSLITFLRSFK